MLQMQIISKLVKHINWSEYVNKFMEVEWKDRVYGLVLCKKRIMLDYDVHVSFK